MKIIKKMFGKKKSHIPVILLHGKISTGEIDGVINFQNKRAVIDAAFAKAKKGILYLSINSPGGLPGQSELLHDYICAQAVKKKVKVISFIEDFGASGGYWLALSGEEIYCLSTSLVGSIGVVSGSFGFQGFLETHKIERRLMTAGESKARNDVFSEQSDSDKQYHRDLLESMHEVFKRKVSERREKVDSAVFDARIAIGAESVSLGLSDGVMSIFEHAEKNFPDTELYYYSGKRMFNLNLLRRFLGSVHAELSETNSPQLRMP